MNPLAGSCGRAYRRGAVASRRRLGALSAAFVVDVIRVDRSEMTADAVQASLPLR
jgi:hypothetical protein